MFWVIVETERETQQDCGIRFMAFPATVETLDEVINIATIGRPDTSKVFVAKEALRTFRITYVAANTDEDVRHINVKALDEDDAKKKVAKLGTILCVGQPKEAVCKS